MLNRITAFFANRMEPGEDDSQTSDERVRVAACALLLELARADEEFSPAERAHIEGALERQFALDPATVRELVAFAGERREDAVDLFQFTRLIDKHYDIGQKMVLMELMWGVVLADGQIAEHESYLMRKISNLLNLAPGYLAEARRSAASRGAD
ncbi:MAG: TerB family tellurite resistance protein [Gemmatimonadaceae bacterium]